MDTTQDRPIELLAPARDLACGTAAIDCGADAVYIGAPRFGARGKAGNAVADIATLADYAHRYWARVYVTVNTLLRNDEFPEALRLIQELHEANADGLIIQDVGLLTCALPPLPLISSTQMHNHTPERVAFLEQVGFARAILARELDLEKIRTIRRAAPRIALECFVHGALCVCYSGQCYLSYALGGRSANRGECAQPCRKAYDLVDANGKRLATRKHLLSLRDLNLCASLRELIEAGVSAFKIEGRLKDEAYVANVTGYYRRTLDALLPSLGLRKASSGAATLGFAPNPDKTFNRGYTDYFLHGRAEPPGSIDTPKMRGEPIAVVRAVAANGVTLDDAKDLHSGDGVSFFDREGVLRGSNVNEVRGHVVVLENPEGLHAGVTLYRNHDHAFFAALRTRRALRTIGVRFALSSHGDGLRLEAEDDDGVIAEAIAAGPFEIAAKPEQALAACEQQLRKTGGTIFACTQTAVRLEPVRFVPVSALNALRRAALEALLDARMRRHQRAQAPLRETTAVFPETRLDYRGNVLNRRAEDFYRQHGVTQIEPAAESGIDLRGRRVMRTRYCILHQLALCPKYGGRRATPREGLHLVDESGARLELRFRCDVCEMEVCRI